MSNIQPTQGLWKWHWRFENGEANGSVYAEPREGHAYAVAICPRYQTKEQWEADAPVIAAAKEMLAALKTAAEIFDDMMRHGVIGECPNYGGYYTGPKAFDCIRNAIESAEGRAP